MKTKLTKISHLFLLLSIMLVFVTSCQKSYEVYSRRTYIALAWDYSKPTFIDAGTYAIPSRFEYNEFYQISPGFYHLYYEGTEYYHGRYRDFAWDMDYEIYYLDEEYSYSRDYDSYFTLELNPFGPEMYESVKSGKTEISGYKVLEYSPDKIVMEKSSEVVGIRVTYKKRK